MCNLIIPRGFRVWMQQHVRMGLDQPGHQGRIWQIDVARHSVVGSAEADSWCRIPRWCHEAMLAQQFDMLVHSPLGLVEAILHGITDAGKAFEIGRIETEEFRVFGGFYDE